MMQTGLNRRSQYDLGKIIDAEHLHETIDNGIGIGQEHFDLVFEAFKKLNNRTDSSGIGLFIIKKVITSGGGKIWVESEKGVGTTFFFTIPK